MSVNSPNPSDIKTIISNAKEPLVIRNILTWDLLSWSLLDWNEKLANEKLQTRCGKNLPTPEPQWERTTRTIKCTFDRFLTGGGISDDEWLYFDYKYLNENLFTCEELRKVTWDSLGYPELTYKDSTIWIGSKGAHTPCHIDTYGCNLIAQIYGRKEWLICPPEENLYPTRVPYEESSIYSKINFFSPNFKQIQNINNARHVVLNPGEVLFLPHGWWHYVENLETAISINAWIPQPEDDEKRLEEAVARLIISQIAKDLPLKKRSSILNPNMGHERIHQTNLTESFGLIESCIQAASKEKNYKRFRSEVKTETETERKADCEVHTSSEFVIPAEKLSKETFLKWAEQKNARFNHNPTSYSKDVEDLETRVIDALLQPDVLTLIKDKLCNKTEV